jgi:hypothetical protein
MLHWNRLYWTCSCCYLESHATDMRRHACRFAGEESDVNHRWNGYTNFQFAERQGSTNWSIRFKTMHLPPTFSSRGSPTAIVIRLQGGISRILGSIAGKRKRFASSPKRPEWPLVPPDLSNGYWRLLPEGIKLSRREANHSSPSSAEAKNAWIYTSTPPRSVKAWFSIMHADNITSRYCLFCKSVLWA